VNSEVKPPELLERIFKQQPKDARKGKHASKKVNYEFKKVKL